MKHTQHGRVSVSMKHVPWIAAIVSTLAACGSKQPTPVNTAEGGGTPPPADTRTEIERRRDAACETLGPRITTCAVEDAKAQLAAGQITQKQYNDTTQWSVQQKNTSEFIDTCRKYELSSRQVRVLEVCQREESACEPLLACLDNLNTPQ